MLVISVILGEKSLADLHDTAENRCTNNLQTISVQWFYKRFGCQQMALLTVKDFLASLKMFYDDHERFSLFSNFLGLPFKTRKTDIETEIPEK
jgi:hypothetical protein